MGQGAQGEGEVWGTAAGRWRCMVSEVDGRVWRVVFKMLEAIENWQGLHMTSSELHFRY